MDVNFTLFDIDASVERGGGVPVRGAEAKADQLDKEQGPRITDQ